MYAGKFKGNIANSNILTENRKGLNSKQANTDGTREKRKKGLTLVQIDKSAVFSLNDALAKKFFRLQKDYKWIFSHKNQLRKEFPNKYIAVENETVRYVGNTIEALMARISTNNEQVDNFAIEYLSQHPTNLLF